MLGFGLFRRLDDVRHPDRVNLVARLQKLLLQVKENFGKPRLFLRKCEYRLIHDLQSQRSAHSLPSAVRHSEVDACFATRLVHRRIGRGLDLQFIRGLHEDQPVVSYRLRVTSKNVGIEIHRACQFRRGCQLQFGLAVFDVHVTREYGLPFFDDVDICSASFHCGEHFQSNVVPSSVHGPFCPQKNLILSSAAL